MRILFTIAILVFSVTSTMALTVQEGQTVNKLKSLGIISNERTEAEYKEAPRTIDMFSSDMKSFSVLDEKINGEVQGLIDNFLTEKQMLNENMEILKRQNDELEYRLTKKMDDQFVIYNVILGIFGVLIIL